MISHCLTKKSRDKCTVLRTKQLLPLVGFDDKKMWRPRWGNERQRKSLITALRRQRGRNKNNWRKTATAMVFAGVVLWFMLHREHAGQLRYVRAVLLSQFYRPLAPCMMHPFTVYHFINTSTVASKVNVNVFVPHRGLRYLYMDDNLIFHLFRICTCHSYVVNANWRSFL